MRRMASALTLSLSAVVASSVATSSNAEDEKETFSQERYEAVMKRLPAIMGDVYRRKYSGYETYLNEVDEEITRERLIGVSDPVGSVLGVGRSRIDRVVKQIQSNPDRYRKVKRFLKQKLAEYRPLFEKNGIPEEYWLIPYRESSFDDRACTHAKEIDQYAKGVWQFIETTARSFDLEVTEQGCQSGDRGKNLAASNDDDERLDRSKSTRAAGQFLKTLIQEFRTPELVLTAYHTGPKNVRGMIKKYGNDFWTWPREDREFQFGRNSYQYAPYVLAAARIAKTL